MNCAAQLAVNLRMFSETDFQRQRTLLNRAKLPLTFADLTPEAICDAMYLDKKTLGGKLRLILRKVVIRNDVDRYIPMFLIVVRYRLSVRQEPLNEGV